VLEVEEEEEEEEEVDGREFAGVLFCGGPVRCGGSGFGCWELGSPVTTGSGGPGNVQGKKKKNKIPSPRSVARTSFFRGSSHSGRSLPERFGENQPLPGLDCLYF